MGYVCTDGLVSIIMPAYNTEKYIGDSIKSVLAQTYEDWELIIVDDDSTDNTLKVIESFKDSRIKVLHNDKHYGAAYSRNKAIREAKGKWIAFLDSDDLWLPEKLEKQIRFMLCSHVQFSFTDYEEINEIGEKNNILVTGPKIVKHQDMFNYNWLGCLTVMYDAEYVGLVQIENVKRLNDYAIWLKIIRKADCYLLDEPLAYYRQGRKGSISDNGYFELIKCHYNLFREAEHFNKLDSLIYTFRNIIFGIYKKLVYVKRK